MTRPRSIVLCCVAVAALLAPVGIGAATGTGPAAPTTAAVDTRGATAADLLVALSIRDTDSPGYDRDAFNHWTDTDQDGCDTRAEILERDAEPGTTIRDGDGCVVGATITDPYTGEQVTEKPGRGSDVDIDHIVSLGDAWRSGANHLTPDERERLANDPANLVAVHDVINREKSDGNAAEFLPPATTYQCTYVAAQVAVKTTYRLTVTRAEHDAIADVLAGCPNQPTPEITP